MKQQNSHSGYGDDNYNTVPHTQFPYITLAEGAERLKIRKPRMSRILRILQIPVYKIGSLILLDDEGLKRARKAIKTKEIKRGRKAHAAN